MNENAMTTLNSTCHVEHSIETSATPAAIWALFRDVAGWKRYNAGIESIELDGPFAEGTWFTMKPPGEEPLRSQFIVVRENDCFVDETRVMDLVVRVAHRIERLDPERTRITYALDAEGPQAAEIGAAISSDFPDVLARLAEVAGTKKG
jgi:hypothetical protein